ncbi:MAG: hypothetical protein U0992_14485 [Planctomycetaceae bacterium]
MSESLAPLDMRWISRWASADVQKMSARSNAEIVLVFLVIAPLTGMAVVAITTLNAVRHAREFMTVDWLLQVGWAGLLGLGAMTALPAVGWQELQKRRRTPSNQSREQKTPGDLV